MARRIYQYDEVLGIRMVANVTARQGSEGGGYLVQSNSDGFRCRHEFRQEKEPGVRRIVLFGDSFTAGQAVAADERFGDLIEATLDKVEVFNLAMTGSGTDQQYLAYNHVGAKLDADLVILTPWIENIRRNMVEARPWNDQWADLSLANNMVMRPKPFFRFGDGGDLELHNVPVPKPLSWQEFEELQDEIDVGRQAPLNNLRRWLRHEAPWVKDAVQRVTRRQAAKEYDRADSPPWLLMKAIIERWHAELDCPMIVCPIPMFQHIEGVSSAKGYQARFQELHRPNDGLHVHDALPTLKRGSRKERRAMRFRTDIHFTPSGHRRFSEALIPVVEQVLADRAPKSLEPAALEK